MYKKRILVPKFNFGGHYLEYILHILNFAKLNSRPDTLYVFALSNEYFKYIRINNWGDNIIFHALSNNEETKLKSFSNNEYLTNYYSNRILRHIVKMYSITEVKHIHIIDIWRFLPFFTIKGVEYSGILYGIYLYEWKQMVIKRRISIVVSYFLMVRSNQIKKLFICNDQGAACYLNKLYHTFKFKSIPDPYVPLASTSLLKFKDFSLIDPGKIVISHFGSLTQRKGTLDILKSLYEIGPDNLRNFLFVFAGKIDSGIKEEFYRYYEKMKDNYSILVKDEYCSFEYISNLCASSNYILMPYMQTGQSSGMFGYAAQFGVPVVAYNQNLHKKIVRRFKLGYLINNKNEISQFLLNNEKYNNFVPSKNYLDINSVKNFINTFL